MSLMSLAPWIGLVSAAFLAVVGLRMVLRPALYLGVGKPPATDPRTVRFFGSIFVAAAIVGFGSALTRVLKG